jgi:cation transport regulator ChaC
MALVFQYGSNCTTARLNGPNRLQGRAKDLGRAQTVEDFDIAFDVVSKTNGCAASDLIQSPGRKAWGVLYRLSKSNLERLREIEGPRYEEKPIQVIDGKRKKRKATTFVVREKDRRGGLATSAAYVSWIVYGLRGHGVPEDWIAHVVDVAIATNERAGANAVEQIRLIKTL